MGAKTEATLSTYSSLSFPYFSMMSVSRLKRGKTGKKRRISLKRIAFALRIEIFMVQLSFAQVYMHL